MQVFSPLGYDIICCIAMIHIQLYTYTCGSKINNNDERTHFFRKIYLSHFIRKGCKRIVKGSCVRGELESEQTATYWPPVPLSLAALLSRSVGLLNRGSSGAIALCWVLVLSPNSTRPQSRLYSDIFDWIHLFFDRRLGRRSICYNIPVYLCVCTCCLEYNKIYCEIDKSWLDWVGKAINGVLCKRLKFGVAEKCYLHQPRKWVSWISLGLWWRIPAIRPDLLLISKKKRTRHLVDFTIPSDY